MLDQYPPRSLEIPHAYVRPPVLEQPPSISVVTPSFGQALFVERTIRSVLDQDYPRLEYVVQDGGSRDGTVDVLERYRARLARCVIAPDRGQAHALNLGFAETTGEPLFTQLLAPADPISEPAHYRFDRSVRRRFDQLANFPEGVLPIGDSICHFNPLYGQGMSAAGLA